MRRFTRITVNANQMAGIPCIRGLRIPVASVVGMVSEGMTEAEILKASRTLSLKTFVKPSTMRTRLMLRLGVPPGTKECSPAREQWDRSRVDHQAP
jgi:hypothetical protein